MLPTMLNRKYLFRMTHIENIPHILQFGITHSSSQNANPNYISIGDSGLINTRNLTLLENGRCLGDYIPFYFWYKMPMLYVIQKGFNDLNTVNVEEIVYCISTVQKIIDSRLEFVFTDGHAVNRFSSMYTSNEIKNIDKILDIKAIKAKYWNDGNDLDKKRRKEAEFLVLGDIPESVIQAYVTYNTDIKNRLTTLGINADKISVKPDFYF